MPRAAQLTHRLRHLAVLGLVLGLCTVTSRPCRGSSCGVADVEGHGWCTGSFPPSALGDSLNLVFRADALAPWLDFDLSREEVTLWVTGLALEEIEDLGGGIQLYTYSSGRFSLHHDAGRDSDYGYDPPNATAPATFVNGSVCLKGRSATLYLFYDSPTRTGAFECDLQPDGGDCAASLETPVCASTVLTGVIDDAQPPITGYAFRTDAVVDQAVLPWFEYLPCFSLASADLHVAWNPQTMSNEASFSVRGGFTESGPGRIDPARHELGVSLGGFQQAFAVRSLEAIQASDRSIWIYTAPAAYGAVTRFELEPKSAGRWSFRVEGRGVPIERLIDAGGGLRFAMMPAPWYMGEVRVALEAVADGYRYRSADPGPCGSEASTPAASDAATGHPRWALTLAPNPTWGATTVRVLAPVSAATRVAIFDLRGAVVRTLHRGPLQSGENRFSWDGNDSRGAQLPSGVYVCRVEAPGAVTTRKLVVIH